MTLAPGQGSIVEPSPAVQDWELDPRGEEVLPLGWM